MTTAVLVAAVVWVSLRPPDRIPAEPTRRPLRLAWLLLAVAPLVLGVTVGSPEPAALALVVAGTGWGAHRWWRQRSLARSAAETKERVLECCDQLVAELAAGQPALAALGRVAETWPAIAPAAQSQAYGGDVPAALRRASEVPGAEGLALVAATWYVAHRTGHGLADGLARVAQAMREARATERVVRGELASARATARLVAALPLVALAIGWGSGGDPVPFLLGTPLGLACLGGGLGIGLAGLMWIERIAAEVGR